MTDNVPPKRRKIATSTRPMAAMRVPHPATQLTWPKNKIPVEIFDIIAQHLPRSSVQNMRLVNKEFEEKISTYLFRTVVVPFRPEIYGLSDEQPGEDGRGINVMLRDKGMRVFQGFGRHILKFAMSFEIDHTALCTPPEKSDQEAITTFWGIYRWPFPKYNRFHMLEGLEQTADETRTMAKALRFIGSAKELGLSMDGGLGWLAGPDVNLHDANPYQQLPVFGNSRFPAEVATSGTQDTDDPLPSTSTTLTAANLSEQMLSIKQQNSTEMSSTYVDPELKRSYERMLIEAGYTGPQLAGALCTMLESEGQSGSRVHPLASVSVEKEMDDESIVGFTASYAELDDFASPLLRSAFNQAMRFIPRPIVNVRIRYQQPDLHQNISAKQAIDAIDGFPLKPNNLKNSQKEMLLETEWAQRAFMQSWTIAIIDNPTTFCNITKLTIARLPSRHLNVLKCEDFWGNLKSLESFTLAVIPDWREVSKAATGWIEDIRLKPSQAVTGVYELLQDQIARQKNINHLHFEWLCGGEEAAGIFARNSLILPAPIISSPADMLNRLGSDPKVLSMPHLKSFTLKNCWISPHILDALVTKMGGQCLQKLVLHSVSLSVAIPPNTNPQPGAGNQAGAAAPAAPAMAMQNGLFAPAPQMPIFNLPLPPNPAQVLPLPHLSGPLSSNNSNSWLDLPRLGSWADMIDRITPGRNLADERYSRNLGPEPQQRELTSLKTLVLLSCGYVKLPIDLDQSILEGPQNLTQETHQTAKRRTDLEGHMMKPEDHNLGHIANHVSNTESTTLDIAWNITTGWTKSMKSKFAQAAIADGIREPGRGRINGTISLATA